MALHGSEVIADQIVERKISLGECLNLKTSSLFIPHVRWKEHPDLPDQESATLYWVLTDLSHDTEERVEDRVEQQLDFETALGTEAWWFRRMHVSRQPCTQAAASMMNTDMNMQLTHVGMNLPRALQLRGRSADGDSAHPKAAATAKLPPPVAPGVVPRAGEPLNGEAQAVPKAPRKKRLAFQ